MSDNTESTVTSVANTKVQALADRVAAELNLAADKVVAHHAAPGKYPMPADSTSSERVLARLFDSLAEKHKKQAAERFLKAGGGGKGVTAAKSAGDLAKVDLSSSASIDAQVKTLPFPERLKFSADELRAAPAPAAQQHAAMKAPAPLKSLELRIHEVKCLEETNEWGKDEIYLGGTSVDESGDTDKVSNFKVRSFKTGSVERYAPPRRFTWFNLTEAAGKFPKSYFVVLVLTEHDKGNLSSFLNALLDKIKDKVADAIAKATGAKLGPAGVVLGPVVRAAITVVLSKVFDYIKRLWGDEVFQPVTVSTAIPSLTSRWAGHAESPRRTVEFRQYGGRYQVVCDWRMYN